MFDFSKEFVEYEKERDILYVLGAGASIADGGILQKHILPELFSLEFNGYYRIEILKKFLKTNFHITEKHCPSLESVFGYLDIFISRNEGLSGKYKTNVIRDLREALIQFIHYQISRSKKSKGVYKTFWSKINEGNKNVSILTMNYDTLLDEAFDFLYPRQALIDYCIHFMNYDDYLKLDAFDWWDDVRKPIRVWNNEKPKPIKIIKIHGSLNWKYCNCCNQVLLTPWNTEINLESGKFEGKYGKSDENPSGGKYEIICPNDGNDFETFIVPPSHIKNLSHPAITKLIDEAAIEIRKAKKIVFIGYSFPEADVHIKALFKKNLMNKPNIEVVDPFLNEAIIANYSSLSDKVSFVKDYFENYILRNC